MKKLPIPELLETKEKFFKLVEPLLSKEEFQKSTILANEFFSSAAFKLQELLKEEDKNSNKSWIYKYWLDMYLSTEGSVNIDANFCMDLKLEEELLNKTNDEILNDFSKGLGKVCHDFIYNNFEEVLDGRGNKLCLSQFEILKGASRIPMIGKDLYNISIEKINYMTIMYKNNLYKIDLFEDNQFYDLQKAISSILKNTSDENKILPTISFLPTSIAGEIREDLYLQNQFFDIVENSLFNISIIDEEFKTLEEKRHHMLYLQGKNSWVFKPLNFIFNLKEKDLYINSDHTFEDAGTVIEIIRRAFLNIKKDIPTSNFSQEIWINEYVDEKNIEKISRYKKEYLELSNSFECKNLEVDFSNEECSTFSKDTIMQMILLYAHYKTYDKMYSVYEAVDMREYSFGRTECIRVLSSQALDFVKALDEESLDKKELLKLINLANDEHKNRIKNAKKANGVDRHLFGLKNMINKLSDGEKQMALNFFNDIAYKNLSQNFVSTTCTGTLDFAGYVLFSPVVYEGVGVTYLKTKEKIVYLLSYKKEKKEKMEKFVKYIKEGASKIKALN